MSDDFLREFLSSSAWQQMQELLDSILGSPILYVMNDSGEILQSLDHHYPEFCRIIRSNPSGLEACKNSTKVRIEEAKTHHCVIMSACNYGLIGYVIPLILDNKIIAYAGGCCDIYESPPTSKKIDEFSSISGISSNEILKYARRIKLLSLSERKRIMDILTMFAGTASLLMKWMNRLFINLDWEQNYTTKIMSLSEIGVIAASELNWDDMLSAISSRARQLLNADACAIYIYEANRKELALKGEDGLLDDGVERRIKIGDGITGHVAQTHLAMGVDDIETDRRFSGTNKPYRAVLSMPLIARDRFIGVMDIYSIIPRSWTQIDIGLLSIIAVQIPGILEMGRFRMEVNKELEIASYIQAKLIPESPPSINGFDISAMTLPSKEVSGDYYDFINIDDNTLGIGVADVSGKGVGASILMANARGLIHAYTSSETSISNVMSKMNNAIYNSTESDKFMTMFCGVLDINSGVFTYTNAGHNPPFLYRYNGENERLEAGGIVLGVMKNMTYLENEVKLGKNDFIVFYSDGLTEASNPEGEMFGEDRLHQSVLGYLQNCKDSIDAKSLVDKIYNDVQAFSSGVSLADDLTLVVLVCNREE